MSAETFELIWFIATLIGYFAIIVVYVRRTNAKERGKKPTRFDTPFHLMMVGAAGAPGLFIIFIFYAAASYIALRFFAQFFG